jgi:hypothetical protein
MFLLQGLYKTDKLVWERREIYKHLVGKPEGKRPLGSQDWMRLRVKLTLKNQEVRIQNIID